MDFPRDIPVLSGALVRLEPLGPDCVPGWPGQLTADLASSPAGAAARRPRQAPECQCRRAGWPRT
jgi:hypothetical protein